MSMSEFKVPRINLNRNYLKPKTAAELQAIDQFIATFSVNILRYMREKAVVTATVAKVTEVVNNTVDAMNQICVTESDHEVVEKMSDGDVKLAVKKLSVDSYEGDDEAFRALFRNCVAKLMGIVDAWKENSEAKERQEIYKRVYRILNLKVLGLTCGDKSFWEIYENEFLPAMDGKMPPYDEWRKINLCAVSGTWKALTAEAISELIELALKDQCTKLGLKDGTLENGVEKFNR